MYLLTPFVKNVVLCYFLFIMDKFTMASKRISYMNFAIAIAAFILELLDFPYKAVSLAFVYTLLKFITLHYSLVNCIKESFITISLYYSHFYAIMFVTTFFASIYLPKLDNFDLELLIITVVVAVVQVLSLSLIINHKKMRKIIEICFEHTKNKIIFLSCILFLILVTLLNHNSSYSYKFFFVLMLLTLFISAVIIIFADEISDDYNTITGLNQKIDDLADSNDNLSKIIHKDNKLIPAIRQQISSMQSGNSTADGEALTKEIDSIITERENAISEYQRTFYSLPKTNIFALDAILEYMCKKALSNNISFDATVNCNLSDLITDTIFEKNLTTMVSDILENAIIAVSGTSNGNVYIAFESVHDMLRITVYDNGPFFAQEVIDNLGKYKITTHEETGGSGIGLYNTLALCKEYKASFTIDESITTRKYTKYIKITFDNKCEVNHKNPISR